MGNRTSSSARIGLDVAIVSATVLLALLLSGTLEPVDLLVPGRLGAGAPVLVEDFGAPSIPDRYSYDGQQTYVVSRAFPDVHQASDDGVAQYRIRRILHPAVGSLAPAGDATVALLALAAVFGVGLAAGGLSDLSRRAGRDPRAGYAALVVLALPLVVTTTEPLAFGFGFVGLALIDRRRLAAATACLALAALTRETALVMTVAGSASLLLARSRVAAALVGLGAIAPLAVWSIYLHAELPDDSDASAAVMGFLDLANPSWLDLLGSALAVALMALGAWRFRRDPLLGLTALGFLACCLLYVSDSFRFEAIMRLSAAGMAVGLAALAPRRSDADAPVEAALP